MTFSRRTLGIFTVVLILSLLGGGVWFRLQPEESDASTGDGDASRLTDSLGIEVQSATSQFSTDIPQPVEGAEVVRDTLWIRVTADGKASAIRQARVTARVPGLVQGIAVSENRRVQEGQTLVQLDTTELALAVRRAEQDLENARVEYEVEQLRGGDIADPAVREQRDRWARASSGLNAAEIQFDQAMMDLERTSVRAPFAGRVADLSVVPGQFVSAGTELLTVLTLDPIDVETYVLEGQLDLLEEGRQADVAFNAFSDETYQGRVVSINPLVGDNNTGRVTVRVDNPDGRIKPGMSARVAIQARSFADRVLVPRAAIVERGDNLTREMVFVFEPDPETPGQGVARWQYVRTGQANESHIEIVPSDEGMVDPGEIVLVGGHIYLEHDTKVRLVENVSAEDARPGA